MLRVAKSIPIRLRIWAGSTKLQRWDESCPQIQYVEPNGYSIIIWLVVDLPLWKIWKSMGTIIPYIMENKKCSKPPTSFTCLQYSMNG